jgi:hypothetical protein
MSYPLFFSNDHVEHAGKQYDIPAHKSYVLLFDTQEGALRDARDFETGMSLLAFKGIIINTLDKFTQSYAEAVIEIATACEEERRKLPQEQHGKIPMDYQRAGGLIQAAQQRMDEAITTVGNWNGEGFFSTVLPYSEIAKHEVKDIVTKKDRQIVDVYASKPYVNGIIFEARWRQ